jgi:hypothetical protein
MNGRLVAGLLVLLLPAVLIGVTAVYFGSNPLSILVLVTLMIVGSLYLMTYPEVLGAHPSG